MSLVEERVLVTGAAGSIGLQVVRDLEDRWVEHHPTDLVIGETIYGLDVTDPAAVARVVVDEYQPTLILHLAGAKSAPAGETDPETAIAVNCDGTRNVLAAATAVGARVVTVSTGKACDPETVYGATKLLAERLTLAAGGSVARLYNVRESAGNVFELWRDLDEDDPIPVTPCWRYFISIDQAVDLIRRAAELAPGRYTVDPGPRPYRMTEIAAELYPGRRQKPIPPRRGDRLTEPLHAACERLIRLEPPCEHLFRIANQHDPAVCQHGREFALYCAGCGA